MAKRIAVLGSTGSIGRQTLDVVRAFPGELAVVGLSAWSNRSLLLEQAWEFQPEVACCQTPPEAGQLPPGCRLVRDPVEVAVHPSADMVVQGMVGISGLLPTLAALGAGKEVALANKEPLVAAGELVVGEARRCGGQLLPVDSEPSAIWQCLRGEDPANGVRRLLITASGGALRDLPLEALARVTPEAALNHPTWRMGRKVTIDSATLMNKAFEVMEAHWLFGVPWEGLEVVVHPQSIVHSMVEFQDGSVKAQMGPPDMRLPIQHALFYPRRLRNGALPRFDPLGAGAITFQALEPARYPCFVLAMEAARAGGTCPAALSGADEVAVEAFLEGRIGFLDIHRVVAEVLGRHSRVDAPSLEEVLSAESWAREAAEREVKRTRR